MGTNLIIFTVTCSICFEKGAINVILAGATFSENGAIR